jgi:hypothetical protein
MKSASAKNLLTRSVHTASMRGAGLNPRSMGMMASRAGQISIPDVGQLPIEEETGGEMQDEDGNFFFFLGYSVMGGDHLLR